ncbi:MAG: hypothetical protein ABI475_01535 [Methylophilaceae bacterium]
MLTKIVLCATNSQLTAGIWRLGKLQSYQVFQNDAQGHQDFSHFLQQHSHITVYLLADAIEEDFRLETLPHTIGNARRELVERKLSQLYRGTIYRAAHFINREKEKRKDDRFLFMSISNTDFLQDWMQCIEAQQASLVGVYLLPMVSHAMVRRMKLTAPHILLSERLNTGLRQTYLHNGRIRISRLVPIPLAAQARLDHFYLAETEKTRLYLMSQRFISRETSLSMVLPALDESSAHICQLIQQEQGIKCSQVDLAKFVRGVHLDPQLLHANPELLHMHLLAIGHVPDNLAPPKLIRHHRLNFVRQWINAATAMIVLGGMVLTGVYLKDSFDQAALAEQATADARSQEQLYSDVAKNFPATPIPSNDLKMAVELKQTITSNAKSPRHMMQHLSKAIEASPEIQINRLRWAFTNDTNIKDDDKTSAAPMSAVPAQPGVVSDPASLHEVGFVNGEIKGFTGDYRAALESVNRLAARLRAESAVEQVVILQEPVNVSSHTSLQGSTAEERAAQLDAALFKFKIILKREVPPT